jgi:glycosyltransferase involved in cell wall biosynthesis
MGLRYRFPMKVLHAFNSHRTSWGSDNAWAETIRLSQESGLEIGIFSRDSKNLPAGWRGKTQAFLSGIYGRGAVQDFAGALDRFRPDVVHTHELYPLISPWILRQCRAVRVPVVQTCYDYRLTCPIATHFVHGHVCERCRGGKEYWAVLNNCRGNLGESVGYALRNGVARGFHLFRDCVAQFIAPTEHTRQWLMREVGIDADRITIQPCAIALPATPSDPGEGRYIAFAGRFSVEKGSEYLIEAARRTGLPVRLAGNAASHPAIRRGDPVECVLTHSREDLMNFYRGARLLVVPSIWHETFGIVAAEAMSHGVPVLAARIGALQYTVSDGLTGLLFEPGDVADLAGKMQRLWDDVELCRKLGAAGRRRVATEFSEQSHVRCLAESYERALARRSAA